jgi:hypothetical protein
MKRILLFCSLLLIVPTCSMAQAGFHAAIVSGDREASPVTERTTGTGNCSGTVPAGTHVFMKLKSPLHTTSATQGSQVYLETMVPVIANNCEVIPEHAHILGTVVRERRPGRIRGKAQMSFHFDELILPDNHEYSLTGDLQSLPGSEQNRTSGAEHTIEPVDQIDADVYTVAGATGAGVLIGSISHIGIGVPQGALIGAGLGLAKVLFTRGDAISLPVGTQVEMVLQRPLTIQPNTDRVSKDDSAKK